MSRTRTETWLAVFVLGIGALVAAVVGLFAYVSATATPLHPNAANVSSVIDAAPSTRWASAVAEAQQSVRTELTSQNLPGLSVAVGIDGQIVWAEGFGWANLESQIKVSPRTRFRIGGISIALTSAAVGLLLEKNQLKLDDEIRTYVPAFPEKEWPVTLRQLMGHMAGIRGDNGDEEPLSQRCDQTLDALQRFDDGALRFQPGTRYSYSSYGWILVSAAVEAAAHESFFSFMRARIFEPLKMDSTRADSATEPISDLATFYYPRFAADTRYGPEMAREGDYSCLAGGNGFLSTPSDLVRFALAINSGKLLQPQTVKLLQTPQRLASGEETGYSLGWDLETASIAGAPTTVVGHDSEFVIGSSASLATFPQRGLVVAVTTNTTFANTSSAALKVAEAFGKQRTSAARR
jgi:serine beta-lactamase-like protein LACTB